MQLPAILLKEPISQLTQAERFNEEWRHIDDPFNKDKREVVLTDPDTGALSSIKVDMMVARQLR